MMYLQLFWAFFQIGLFSIGGGYAALPLIQHQVVELHGWLTMAEFADVITISQMTPGPIAINAATFVGTRLGGIPGAVVATVSCVLAPCIIVLILAVLYAKYKNLRLVQGVLEGLRPAVVGLIASAALTILMLSLWNNGPVSWNNTDPIAIALILLCFPFLRKLKLNPTLVILGCGVLGGLVYSLI